MLKRLLVSTLQFTLGCCALLTTACATPAYNLGESACHNSQSLCLDYDSDCAVDNRHQCVVCVCAKHQRSPANPIP
jgi:hypothetical protein